MPKFLKSPRYIIGAFILIIIFIIIFQRLQLSQPLKNVVFVFLRPIQTSLYEAANRLKNITYYFRDRQATQDENIKLKDAITQLTVENQQLKNTIADINLLNVEQAFLNTHQYNAVSAKVIGSSSDNYSQVILINQGTSSGIQIGYPVIVNNGVIVGKIIEANYQLSKILLLNDNHSQLSAVVQNPTKSPGIISGRYSLTLNMDLIPQDQQISTDQLAVTSGLEQYIPPDLIIGKITNVTKKDGELFQQASIEPSVFYHTLSVVSVIVPSS